MPRYELNVKETIVHNHRIIIETSKDKDELDSLLDSYIGIRNSVNDVIKDGLEFGLKKELTMISEVRDSKGIAVEALIDEIEEI